MKDAQLMDRLRRLRQLVDILEADAREGRVDTEHLRMVDRLMDKPFKRDARVRQVVDLFNDLMENEEATPEAQFAEEIKDCRNIKIELDQLIAAGSIT